MKNKLILTTFRNVALAAVYIFGISQFMFFAEQLFGKKDTNLTPFIVLLLFSLSAAVVGSLVFGQAVMLFLDNKQSESVRSGIYSVMWLFLITLIAVITLIIIK